MEASPRWLGLLELAPSVRVYTDASQKTFVELQPFLRVPLRPVLALDPDWDEKTEQQILQTYDHAGWHYGVRLTMGLRD